MLRGGYNKKWERCICVDPTGNIIAPDASAASMESLLVPKATDDGEEGGDAP